MPDDPYAEPGDEDGRPWDEHRWERFLQASDRRTEKFGQLLERYQDHPDRDAIIAREMGWNLDPEDDDNETESWQRELSETDAPFQALDAATVAESEFEDDQPAEREPHPLFLQARAYSHRLLKLVDETADDPSRRALNDLLVGGAMVCAAKLSILSLPEPRPELGMLIAYAKRSLKALTDSLGAIGPARQAGILSPADAGSLQNQAFQVRSGIISLMGELRTEFRRRHG